MFNMLFGKRPQAPNVQTSDMPGQLYDSAQQYMDPSSRQNRMHFDRLRGMGADSAAQHGLMGNRSMAAGVNPFANEQHGQAYRQGQGQAYDAFGNLMQQQQGAGLNLMGLAMQGDMNNMQAANQAEMLRWQANQQRNQGVGQFMGGLLGQAASFAMPTLGIGIGSMFGEDRGWDTFKSRMSNHWG